MAQQSWKTHESPDFGKYAIKYAAGKDIILDEQLIENEIKIDKAHIVMLSEQQIVTKKVAKQILKSLQKLEKLHKAEKWGMDPELEDVHSNVERFILDETGVEVGGNLRMGIARNDQIYTNTKMYMKQKLLIIIKLLIPTVEIFNKLAEKHKETIMPGYTHLRPSQPITYGFWLLGKAYHFLDDIENLIHLYDFIDYSPLGVVQMAGTHLPIDRKLTAKLLGFSKIAVHAQYAAQQRGEIEIKLLSELSMLAVHIRRIMNEVIIFSGIEFGMMEVDDLYATGGTGQPNLKNPDTLEVIRANCTSLYGKLIQAITIMDMLPSGNNRDPQQTKPVLFDGLEEIESMLPIFNGIIDTIEIYPVRMNELANLNYGNAPDLCMYLAEKSGFSFRQIYKVIKYILKKTKEIKHLSELTTDMFAKYSKLELGKQIDVEQKDIDFIANVKNSVFIRKSLGGTAPKQVEKMTHVIANSLNEVENKLKGFENEIIKSDKLLKSKVKDIVNSK